jgi:hypothetical protein
MSILCLVAALLGAIRASVALVAEGDVGQSENIRMR